MRRITAASAARDALLRLVPPCSWRVHGESCPWKFSHQFTSCCHASRRAPRLGRDRICGFRPSPVRRADLLRLGLHRAIATVAAAPHTLKWLGGGWLLHPTPLVNSVRQVVGFSFRGIGSRALFLNPHFAGGADFSSRDRAT